MFFGEDEDRYIAWLPVCAAPSDVTLVSDGQVTHADGIGYHDHNWGNVALRKILDHWYWGRACVGDYTVVTLMFTGASAYGGLSFPSFMVARSGRSWSPRWAEQIDFRADDVVVAPTDGSPDREAADRPGRRGRLPFAVTFERREDSFMLDFGDAGAYHRFGGDLALERFKNDRRVESVRQDAIWEPLYFGQRSSAAGTTTTVPHESSPILVHEA